MDRGRRKRRDSGGGGGAPLWMVTFGDMMSLLLCFFVLLLSFSSIEMIKFQRIIGFVKKSLGLFDKQERFLLEEYFVSSNMSLSDVSEVAKSMEEMESEMEETGLSKWVDVELTDKGAHFVIGDLIMFDSGKAQLKPSVFRVLDMVADIIEKSGYEEIRVDGHTDNVPIHTLAFPSNWELSAARAVSVVKYLAYHKGIPPARLSAAGYGEYHPIRPNTRADNRAKNRRVEIFVQFTGGFRQKMLKDSATWGAKGILER